MRTMKILLMTFFAVAAVSVHGQNCDAIVLPQVQNDMSLLKLMPQEKYDYYCMFSRASFFTTDEIPNNSIVYSLTQLHAMDNPSQQLDRNFVVDLDNLSYYAYNFVEFQRNDGVTVYFATPASSKKYLGLRGGDVAHQEAEAYTDHYRINTSKK